jgi:hypothetical protein
VQQSKLLLHANTAVCYHICWKNKGLINIKAVCVKHPPLLYYIYSSVSEVRDSDLTWKILRQNRMPQKILGALKVVKSATNLETCNFLQYFQCS